jgi:hypothetical protein
LFTSTERLKHLLLAAYITVMNPPALGLPVTEGLAVAELVMKL